MMPHVLQSRPDLSGRVSGAPSNENYVIPAWAVEAAASAPRISPADAAPLIAVFTEALTAFPPAAATAAA